MRRLTVRSPATRKKSSQRRALLVLDDYIVVADFVKGTNAHTFEDLLQLKGFQGLDAPEKKFLRHDAQWNPDPVGSAQFVTDCDWYSVNAPAVARFIERWGRARTTRARAPSATRTAC